MAKSDPVQPLRGHKPVQSSDTQAEYNVTKLSNGFTVLTESQIFPGAVHMGMLMDVGTRDETMETSGACLALKNTYLKTLKHTNETINYGMIQMSGGDMQMDYDQEKTYFRGNCTEYDVVDMFQMLVDIALEPKSVLAANVARSKNGKSHDLANHLHKYDPFSHNKEMLMRTAYGFKTLGMPTIGLEKNVDNIDARMLQQFVMDNVTPSKCLIVAGGVKNHSEFVDLVKERLGDMLPVPEHQYNRPQAEYIGGEYRTWTESPQTNIQLAFESVPWSSGDVMAFQVMESLIGCACSNTTKVPGQGVLNRATGILGSNGFVDGAGVINANFSDSGIFGVCVEGHGAHASDLLSVATDTLNALKNDSISDEELNRAKNQLKMKILTSMECNESRLEEVARNFMTMGQSLTFHQYCDQIDAVTSDDINKAA